MLDELPLELHELYHSLYTEWATHLASVGINFPNGKGKVMSLLCLYAHIGQPISQVEMIDWIEIRWALQSTSTSSRWCRRVVYCIGKHKSNACRTILTSKETS